MPSHPDDTPEVVRPTVIDRVQRILGIPTEHTAGDPGTSEFFPEPTDGADGVPLSGAQGVGPATFMSEDGKSTWNQPVWSERVRIPIDVPVLIAPEPLGVWVPRTYTLTANVPKKLCEANPNRIRLVIVASTSNSIRLAPDESSVQTVYTSYGIVTGKVFDYGYPGEMWAMTGTGQDIEVMEFLRSGVAPGWLPEMGGN